MNLRARTVLFVLVLLLASPVSADCNPKESWLNISAANKDLVFANRNFVSMILSSNDLGSEERLMADLVALANVEVTSEITHLGVLASIYAREKNPSDRRYINDFAKVTTNVINSRTQTAVDRINSSITKLRNQSLIMQAMALRDSLEKVRDALTECTR